MTKTAQAIKLAKKKRGITRVDFLNLGFSENGFSSTINNHFMAKGTKKVNGKVYTNYVAV